MVYTKSAQPWHGKVNNSSAASLCIFCVFLPAPWTLSRASPHVAAGMSHSSRLRALCPVVRGGTESRWPADLQTRHQTPLPSCSCVCREFPLTTKGSLRVQCLQDTAGDEEQDPRLEGPGCTDGSHCPHAQPEHTGCWEHPFFTALHPSCSALNFLHAWSCK